MLVCQASAQVVVKVCARHLDFSFVYQYNFPSKLYGTPFLTLARDDNTDPVAAWLREIGKVDLRPRFTLLDSGGLKTLIDGDAARTTRDRH